MTARDKIEQIELSFTQENERSNFFFLGVISIVEREAVGEITAHFDTTVFCEINGQISHPKKNDRQSINAHSLVIQYQYDNDKVWKERSQRER